MAQMAPRSDCWSFWYLTSTLLADAEILFHIKGFTRGVFRFSMFSGRGYLLSLAWTLSSGSFSLNRLVTMSASSVYTAFPVFLHAIKSWAMEDKRLVRDVTAVCSRAVCWDVNKCATCASTDASDTTEACSSPSPANVGFAFISSTTISDNAVKVWLSVINH